MVFSSGSQTDYASLVARCVLGNGYHELPATDWALLRVAGPCSTAIRRWSGVECTTS